MRKFTLIILMIIISCSVKGQVEVAPVGAEWYYERLIMNYETWKYEDVTYDRFRSLGVVEINGWQCKEIELFQNVDCDGNVNPYYETRYINQEGEQIYEVVDGERYLLYDFSKEVGEYWIITHRPPFELPELPETDTVFVDEIKEIVLADGSKRRMFVTSVNVETCLYCTNIIEGIGLDESLFPFYVLLGPPACMNTGIRCYSEDDNYLITSDVECDYEELSLEEYAKPSIICNTIIDDCLNIQFNDISKNGLYVSIYDIIGNLIYKDMFFDNSVFIDLSNQMSGMYFVKIDYNSDSSTFKIIKL